MSAEKREENKTDVNWTESQLSLAAMKKTKQN